MSALSRHGPNLVAAAFLACGLLALPDYGVTWDEPWTHQAGSANLELIRSLASAQAVEFPWQELPGFYFAFDTLRGAVAALCGGFLALPTAHHLVHLLLSTLALCLLGRLVLEIGGSPQVALLSVLSLALFPKFIAHSQSNPKDLLGLFVFTLAAYCVTRTSFRGGLRNAVLGGLALGFAGTSSVLAALIPVILGLWLFVAEGDRMRSRAREYGVLLVAGAAAFFVLWPWLWPHPIARLGFAIAHAASFQYHVPILYLGHIHAGTAMPWHYFSVSFLVSAPLCFLLFAAVSLRSRDPVARLGWVWCGVLALFELRSPSRYDGIRHFLAILPGFSLLVGVGADRLLRLASRRGPRRVLGAAVAASYAHVFASMVLIHPYQDAYLNEVTNWLIPAQAEDYLEIEYWGGSYQEGARWLNAHAEEDAAIYVPWTLQANYHLAREARLVESAEEEIFQGDSGRPQYLMTITRKAFYTGAMQRIEREYQPVFSVQRQKGTLLRIYKHGAEAPRVP